MRNWVILFVKIGSEKRLERALKEKLNAADFLPFLPTRETPYRSKGVVSKKRVLLFPGYLFIQTEIESGQISPKLNAALMNDDAWPEDIIKILHYGDDENNVAVREKERLYWERLFDPDFCVAGSTGIIEGDTIRITSGPLVGMESKIKKINRHKREAVVEMEAMGAAREVRLMLAVVEKTGRT